MAYTLTQEQVAQCIAEHDLSTYQGWINALAALLANAPAWTAVHHVEDRGYTVKGACGGIFACPEESAPNHLYTAADLYEYEGITWDKCRGCWDESTPAATQGSVRNPVFVALPNV